MGRGTTTSLGTEPLQQVRAVGAPRARPAPQGGPESPRSLHSDAPEALGRSGGSGWSQTFLSTVSSIGQQRAAQVGCAASAVFDVFCKGVESTVTALGCSVKLIRLGVPSFLLIKPVVSLSLWRKGPVNCSHCEHVTFRLSTAHTARFQAPLGPW